ncbi:peptidase U32 family protein [Alkalitalea saponilacus]|uniref:Putative protease n=1 Tax=Alkalitalea saponilacus TaxID=889453 RepID=A0A1T5H3M5_9BACT|nr:U32 family peptidase [Alkalitalea saponilacus]ASB50899.1 collagenase-like protease [Alkalitalea saponilacus]SKC15211.1 putative protease [Alkalitalea saponilacus]
MLQEKGRVTSLELLAPARDLECGLAAINHGADAVYTGAPKFGARAAAGNSLTDIATLTEYAHLFNAKVYVAINTLLYDHELTEAEKLIHQLYKIGVDAIIIQDMGITQMNLPPIAVHASTQTDNRTPEKVKFLEDAGFDQVVLARELTLNEIAEIRNITNVPLEFFIHGALCVSYSGQCYMSQATSGRSANRGECSQPCRLPYSLENLDGKTLIKNQHLLSLKDLSNTNHLHDLIKAGISSFKIEGRLKDATYVKNVTSWYRQQLDRIIETDSNLARSSSGRVTIPFEPSPAKTFSRGFTTYFLNGREKDIWSLHTPKSLGEKLGRVVTISRDYFIAEDGIDLNNGDGICFLNKSKQLRGFRINKTVENKVYADDIKELYTGAMLYRNHDQLFEKQLINSKENRRIAIDLNLSETEDGISLQLIDEDGLSSEIRKNIIKEPAKNPDLALKTIGDQLSKWGNTIYNPNSIKLQLLQPIFIPAAEINAVRRELNDVHKTKRLNSYRRQEKLFPQTSHPYPNAVKDFSLNVSNHLAQKFYNIHGVKKTEPAFEIKSPTGARLMTTRHCIRYATNSCPKENPKATPENLILKSGKNSYELKFDCKKCEMMIFDLDSNQIKNT